MYDFFTSKSSELVQAFPLNQTLQAGRQCTYENPFAYVELNLSNEGLQALNAYSFTPPYRAGDMGFDFKLESLSGNLHEQIYNHLASHSPSNSIIINHISNLILNIANGVANNLDNKTHATLSIQKQRSSIKGWHTDSFGFGEPCVISNSKIIVINFWLH